MAKLPSIFALTNVLGGSINPGCNLARYIVAQKIRRITTKRPDQLILIKAHKKN